MQLWVWLLAGFGVGWRLFRYALGMPVWGDEAMVGISIVERGYRGLMEPLIWGQVAPLLFLWGERLCVDLWGMNEYAMRVLPTLVGLAGLAVFWAWAKRMVSPMAAALATGLVAVSHYVVRHSVELKPYGYDFTASVTLCYLATRCVLDKRWMWWAALILFVPLAIFMSFPSVFVAGGVAVLLMREFKARGGAVRWGAVTAWALYCIVLGGAFALMLRLSANSQYEYTKEILTEYWKDGFPPGNVLGFAGWFVRMHTGNLFAYPVGGKNGASALSVGLWLVGLWAWWRGMPRYWLVMLVLPFVLNFVAAAMHRYPYAESARISQHLAPLICLVMGVGGAALIERFARSEEGRRKGFAGAMAGLLVVGLVGVGDLVLSPYKTKADADARLVVRQVTSGKEKIYVMPPRNKVNPNYQWYLLEAGFNGKGRLHWEEEPPAEIPTEGMWVINGLRTQDWAAKLEEKYGKPSEVRVYELQLGPKQAGTNHLQAVRYVRHTKAG